MDQEKGHKCKYRYLYFDYEKKDHVWYDCPRHAVTDRGYCEFHDPHYWREHEEEVRSKFEKIVENALKNNEKLLCIGFHLPTVKIKGKFEKPAYFTDAVFQEADFTRA